MTRPTPAPPARPASALFRIPTMDCMVEESQIRRALEPVQGVRGLLFQLGARTLAIDAEPGAMGAALDAIRKAGFEPQPIGPQSSGRAGGPARPPEAARDCGCEPTHGQAAHGHAPSSAQADAHESASGTNEGSRAWGGGLPRLAAALALATVAELLELAAPDGNALQWAGMAIAAAAIWLAGTETYVKGLGALRRLRLDINALMALAVTGAFAIGQWPEAAMVMALYAIAELIEARSVDRARNAIQKLLDLAPQQADVLQSGGDWRSVPADSVEIGAIVRLRPGARVPLDGTITRGSSAIDQSPVTGESIPVDKAEGDAVFAGTINQTGELEFRTTAGAADTTLARIIHAVEQAQGTRAPTQRFVDRFAAVYTPAVFVLALGVAIVPPLVSYWSWGEAVYKALVLLVIACPCALVISTPVTVVSALAAAARRGILVKGGTYLEEARKLRVVAFDKTGTITEGKPRLVQWEPLQDGPGGEASQVDRGELARIAAALASRSDHPVSLAIAAGLDAEAAGPAAEPLCVDGFEALAGRGVAGRVAGSRHALGNHRMVHERGQCGPALEARLREHEQAGRTVTLLVSDAGALAVFAVADTIKPSSRQAVAELRSLGVAAVLLSGDNEATAASIAAQAGIEHARGNLLPEDKLAAIEALRREHGPVAMAGDGINDAPALARADLGIAMGGAGTDAAMEAADVVVMNDDLRRIAQMIRLSQRTHAVLRQNIALALGIKAVFFALALAGGATMWMAVFADMGASLLVVANGLRLLRWQPAPPGGAA